jgi:two-component system response regulator
MTRHLEVLLVEDDPGDVVMTQEAFADARLSATLHVTRDGVEALDFLRHGPGYDAAPRPDLVLLDLNLPRLAGHEVLAAIRGDAELTQLPVVVLTTSSAQGDVEASYRLHANAHVTKPTDYAGFTEVLAGIEDFFTRVARLP